MKIHYEDDDLIVATKPPGISSQADMIGDASFDVQLAEYIKNRDGLAKIGLHVVHRLDRPVGGLIVYAKSKRAAAALTKCIQERALKKTYLCVVHGIPETPQGELIHYLKKKSGQNLSLAVHANNEGAKMAKLSYQLLESSTAKAEKCALLQVDLETGRHHQIRVQMSTVGLPLWGDSKYGRQSRGRGGWKQIALWSHSLSFTHPFTGTRMDFNDWPDAVDPWTRFKVICDNKKC